MTTQVPVADGIFVWPSDEPRLLASRCSECDAHVFPVQDGCPRCMADANETVELATRGTLWTWTIQGFPPKAPPYLGPTDPQQFRPFGVGYVELPGQLRIETRLTEADPDRLRIGMEVELVFEPLGTDDEGNEILTYAFRPTSDSGVQS